HEEDTKNTKNDKGKGKVILFTPSLCVLCVFFVSLWLTRCRCGLSEPGCSSAHPRVDKRPRIGYSTRRKDTTGPWATGVRDDFKAAGAANAGGFFFSGRGGRALPLQPFIQQLAHQAGQRLAARLRHLLQRLPLLARDRHVEHGLALLRRQQAASGMAAL